MIDLFLAIFFLLFIQLFIGAIIIHISAFKKYSFLYYEYDKIEKNKNWFNHFFEFKPIYNKNITFKEIKEILDGDRFLIELKYIMAIFGIGMSIDYLLNLF